MNTTEKGKVIVIEDDSLSIRLIPMFLRDTNLDVSTFEWNLKLDEAQPGAIDFDEDTAFVVDGLNGKWINVVKFLKTRGINASQIVIHTAGDFDQAYREESVNFIAKPTGESLVVAIEAITRKRD